MGEHEPHGDAEEPEGLDFERMESAGQRFEAMIARGIDRAKVGGTELDLSTTRLIAHVLGRALGRASHLAEYGRIGEGTYEQLRDEYLSLYNDPITPGEIKMWIDWFGTSLIHQLAEGSNRAFMNESLPPQIERLLVRSQMFIGDVLTVVQVPATLDAAGLEALAATLDPIVRSDYGAAFRAYLWLWDVNAADPNVVESFHTVYMDSFPTVRDALYAVSDLTDWEREIIDFAADRGIADAVSIDLEVIEKRVREVYDLIELGGRVHVFAK